MDINSFFDMSKPLVRQNIIKTPVTDTSIKKDPTPDQSPRGRKRPHQGQEYAFQIKVNETANMLLRQEDNEKNLFNDLDDMTFSSDDETEETKYNTSSRPSQPLPQQKLEIYERFNVPGNRRAAALTIEASRVEILDAIEDNQVIIINGVTGCGKSTQVPQFIIDKAARKGEFCNMAVTQPRRIAAVSLARRVCEERGWECGTFCGYQIGHQVQTSEDTRILFCTTGVLLQKLITQGNLSDFTHIILDEVHEREEEMDFLLIVIRRFLMTTTTCVKIILMSATVNADKFSEYFTMFRLKKLIKAPVVKVSAARQFKVAEFYTCNLNKLNPPAISYDNPTISLEMYQVAYKVILICHHFDKQEAGQSSDVKPTILVFLPGIGEITNLMKFISKAMETDERLTFKLLPLHSTLSSEEQHAIFKPPPPGMRKIILSTNIAESSITVPDVKFVIDFCLTKNLVTDSSTNLTSLQLGWASKSSCIQRAGRAGRVMNGRVYRLVPKAIYESYFEANTIPAMIRVPLANIVLKAKQFSIGKPVEILGLAMDPPNLSDILNAILVLKEVGAMTLATNSSGCQYESDDGDLTFIGEVMAQLPLDIRIAKLIMLGYIFNMLPECVIIGVGISVRNIFVAPFNTNLDAYNRRLKWANGSGSDLFAILNAYKEFTSSVIKVETKDEASLSSSEEQNQKYWARRHHINLKSMRELHDSVQEVHRRLGKIGVRANHINRPWTKAEETLILKVIIAGAFYPNYFALNSCTGQHDAYQRDIVHEVNELDVCNTVYFKGFKNRQHIGPWYKQSIEAMLRPCVEDTQSEMFINFDQASEKVMVTFNHPRDEQKMPDMTGKESTCKIPGRVGVEVFRAIKMQKLRMPFELDVMLRSEDFRMALRLGLGELEGDTFKYKDCDIPHAGKYVIPLSGEKEMEGIVTHIESCGRFWLQLRRDQSTLANITKALNDDSCPMIKIERVEDLHVHQVVAVYIKDKYHRGSVISQFLKNSAALVKVFLIDAGHFREVSFSQIRLLPTANAYGIDLTIPPRVLECRLASIQPSAVYSPQAEWTKEANTKFKELVKGERLRAEIYSVINAVANVILHSDKMNINQALVAGNFAQHADESFMSKKDHIYREQVQSQTNNPSQTEDLRRYLGTELRNPKADEFSRVLATVKNKCTQKVQLYGPLSPLDTKMSTLMRLAHGKLASVENDSVNSVLLNNEPHDPHERFLVAASLSENSAGTQLMARQTTLMPNIHGLAPILALIFCPRMELQLHKDGTRIVSVLTGLGYNPETLQSHYEEHDMVFVLDVHIDEVDLKLINEIRHAMDAIVFKETTDDLPAINDSVRQDLTEQIRRLVLRLLSRHRPAVDVQFALNGNLWGGMSKIYPEDLDLTMPKVYGLNSIFPVHPVVRLKKVELDRVATLFYLNNKLKVAAKEGALGNISRCSICQYTLETIVDLKLHLCSQMHRDREAELVI